MAKFEVSGTPMKLDMVSEDLKKEIIKKRLPPFSWSIVKISQWLKNDHGVEVSHPTVEKWLDRRQASVSAGIFGSKEYSNETQRIYGEIMGEYFISLKSLIKLMREVCNTTKIDMVGKANLATKLFDSIKDGTLAARDLVVGGQQSAGQNIIDIEKDIQDAYDEVPVLRLLVPEGEKESKP